MQTLIVIIPFKGKLSDNRSKLSKNFTKLGWFLISCCIVTTICTVIFFILTDSEEEKSKLTLSTQLQVRDSLHQQRIIEAGKSYTEKLDSSNKNTIEALAKYGLKYDTAQKKIEKLVSDSSKRNITIIQGNDPIFGLCSDNGIRIKEKHGDTLDLIFSYCYKYSPANLTLSLYTVGVIGGQFILIGKMNNYFSKKNGFEIDGGFEDQLTVLNGSKSSKLYFYLTGSYTKKGNGKIIVIDEVNGYDLNVNESGFPSDKIKENIKSFVNTIK
jgi:hypothetical protein